MKLKKFLTEILIPIIVTLIVATVLLVVGVLVSTPIIKENNMYVQCCNGSPCSDTYYTIEDNQCHLTMCENQPLFNEEDCTYDGVNITNGTLI